MIVIEGLHPLDQDFLGRHDVALGQGRLELLAVKTPVAVTVVARSLHRLLDRGRNIGDLPFGVDLDEGLRKGVKFFGVLLGSGLFFPFQGREFLAGAESRLHQEAVRRQDVGYEEVGVDDPSVVR